MLTNEERAIKCTQEISEWNSGQPFVTSTVLFSEAYPLILAALNDATKERDETVEGLRKSENIYLSKLATMGRELAALNDATAERDKVIAEMLKTFEELEWSGAREAPNAKLHGIAIPMVRFCPSCYNEKSEGHLKDCALATVVAKARKC